MKRLVCILALIALIFSLPACGNSGNSSSKQQSVDSLAAATDEFNSAIQSLSEAQTSLLANVSEAGDFVATVTSEDVADPILLEDLHAILEVAGIYLDSVYIPEIESEAEEIRIQTQAVMDQVNQMESYQYDINSAVASVKASQQDLTEKQRIDNVTAKEVCVGKVSTETGYEAEYTVSVTNWFKASDTEALQLAWDEVAAEGSLMPAISQFHSSDNDGFTEANAAIAFGTISFCNVTQGFDITPESPVTFGVALTTSLDSYGRDGSKIYIDTNPPQQFGFRWSPYPGVAPIMKSNTWGPRAFMIVRPNVFTPSDPDGSILNDFVLYFNEHSTNKGSVNINTSW